jgi:hypothetical protein
MTVMENPNCIICNSQCAFLLKLGKGYVLHYCKNCFHIQSNTAQNSAQSSAQSIGTGTGTGNGIESTIDNNDISFTREPHKFIQKFKSSTCRQLLIKLPVKSFVTEFDYNFIKLEQVSFFCTNSLKLLCDKNGVYLNKVNIDGDNFIYLIEKEYKHANSIIEQLLQELENELYSENTYFKYTSKYIILKNIIQNYILLQKLITL